MFRRFDDVTRCWRHHLPLHYYAFRLRYVLRYITAYYGISWYITVCYGMLRYTTACYGMLRHITVYNGILRCITISILGHLIFIKDYNIIDFYFTFFILRLSSPFSIFLISSLLSHLFHIILLITLMSKLNKRYLEHHQNKINQDFSTKFLQHSILVRFHSLFFLFFRVQSYHPISSILFLLLLLLFSFSIFSPLSSFFSSLQSYFSSLLPFSTPCVKMCACVLNFLCPVVCGVCVIHQHQILFHLYFRIIIEHLGPPKLIKKKKNVRYVSSYKNTFI